MRKQLVVLSLILGLAVSFSAVILNLRQDHGVYNAKDVLDLLRENTRHFASDVVWSKVDTYGHFGDWIQEKEDRKEIYYSIFSHQQEVRSLWRLSISLNSESTERVALVANGLGVSHGLLEEAVALLRGSIQQYPDQIRLYRLFGEMGILYFQVLKDGPRALRWFEKSLELLDRVPREQYNFDDVFNIKIYAFSASLIHFRQGNHMQAYEYHKMAFFESGPPEYDLVMDRFVEMASDQQNKAEAREYVKNAKKLKDEEDHHHHDHHHHHHDDHHDDDHHDDDDDHHEEHTKDHDDYHDDDDEHAKGHEDHHDEETESHRGQLTREQMSANNKELFRIYNQMIPRVNTKVYPAITNANTMVFALFAFLFLGILLFRSFQGSPKV